jgi:signal transduction histidine kinase
MKADADRADARGDYEREIEIYRGLLETPDPNQREFVRLLLAGAYMRAKRDAEGLLLYRELLNLSSDVVDETGLPLALYRDGYAAHALLKTRAPALEREVLNRVNREIGSIVDLARSAPFVRPILEELEKSADGQIRADARSTMERLRQRTDYLQRMRMLPAARRLQAGFGSLGVTPQTWRAFADAETWLIGMTAGDRPIVIAVRSGDIRNWMTAERGQPIEFILGGGSGEPLHENIPGLRVILPPALSSDHAGPRGRIGLPILFAIALAFVGVLLPACLWLLWRDTQREVHLAELRSQFVSSVSHELKTPLTAIRMLAETLQMRSTNPQKHAQYLDTIVNESERLTRLLNNVLDFSRIERGQKDYQLRPGDLARVVESAASTMRFPLMQQGFKFRVDVHDEIPPMPIDRDALEQAVLNLLSNAMKYSGETRDVALRLSRQNGHAVIQVEDHGVGIAAKEQKRIFEKFYRIPTPENGAVSGTGLGLALVAHIAEAHGGSVEVDSVLGKGSTFSIRLPLTAAGAASNHANQEAS